MLWWKVGAFPGTIVSRFSSSLKAANDSCLLFVDLIEELASIPIIRIVLVVDRVWVRKDYALRFSLMLYNV